MVNIKTTFRNTLYPVLYIVHINILEIDIRNLILFLDFYLIIIIVIPIIIPTIITIVYLLNNFIFFGGGGDGGSFILNPSLLKYLSDEVFFL